MYADDTTLSTSINCSENYNNCDLINSELSKINEWLIVNKLSLNTSKTMYMLFHMPQKKIVYPRLIIANKEIESVEQFNFLGITLDHHLNWNAHVDKLVSKISRTAGVLPKLKSFLPGYILKTLYTSLILCHLNYCILAWGHTYTRIFKLQKRVIRIITFSKFNAHTEPRFKQMRLLKIQDILKLQEFKFYFKLINHQLPSYFNCIPIVLNSAVHHHTTRTASNIFITRVNHEYAKRCIRYRIIHTVNSTHISITSKISTHSLSGFSYFIKMYILSNYTNVCQIINCYICSANTIG